MSYLIYPTHKFEIEFKCLLEKKCTSYKYKKALIRNKENVSLDFFEKISTTNVKKKPGSLLNLNSMLCQNSLYKTLFFFIHTETVSNYNILFDASIFTKRFNNVVSAFFLYPNKNGILILAGGMLGFVSLKDIKEKNSFMFRIDKNQDEKNFFLQLYQITNNKNIVGLRATVNILNPMNVKRFVKKKKQTKITDLKPFLEFVFI